MPPDMVHVRITKFCAFVSEKKEDRKISTVQLRKLTIVYILGMSIRGYLNHFSESKLPLRKPAFSICKNNVTNQVCGNLQHI